MRVVNTYAGRWTFDSGTDTSAMNNNNKNFRMNG